MNRALGSIEFEELQAKKIKNIIDFAIAQIPYYSNLSTNDVSHFPVINKNIIRDNFDKFTSKSINISKCKKVVTSGSTGTPFEVIHDRDKIIRNTADTIYFSGLAGYEIGYKLFYCKIWNEHNKKSILESWLQNITQVDVLRSDDEKIKNFIQQIRDSKGYKSILAYSSFLDEILKYCIKNKINLKNLDLKSVLSMSEALDEFTKHHLSDVCGVNVISRYSNVENGILGQQSLDGTTAFFLNHASYYFEILDLEKDQPVKMDVPGRIVITDLYNKAMPLIRYDTGDIGIMTYDSKLCRKIMTSISGRKMDQIFDTNGKVISSFTITNQMWKYTDLKQYKFIQTGPKSYKFILNPLNPDNKFNREQELINEFKDYLGEDAIIIVDYTHEIPLLDSGKRRKVVQEFYI